MRPTEMASQAATRIARRVRAARKGRADAGATLVEILIAVLLAGILAAGIAKAIHWATSDAQTAPDRAAQWDLTLDASGQLVRDIGHAVGISTAEPQRVVMDTVLSGECVRRDYQVVGGEFVVDTWWYGQETCQGDLSILDHKTETLLKSYTGTATFTYLTAEGRAIPTPVGDRSLRNIKNVSWTIATQIPGLTKPQTLDSAQAFNGRDVVPGSVDECTSEFAQAPLLTVTTGRPGIDRPVLTWSDPSSSLTTGWTIWRVVWDTGKAGTNQMAQVAYISDRTITTWTDVSSSLKAGDSAKYVVQADLPSCAAAAPLSNAVVTGLRPPAVSGLTATGSATSVALTWSAAYGATSYDVYRDNVLIRTGLNTTTFADASGQYGWTGSGYGHNHTYRVVAVNRWEQTATGMGEANDLPIGSSATTLPGSNRAFSNPATAFTAPLAPTVVATPNSDDSNTVTWTANSTWVGTGGTAKATLNAGWEAQRHETSPTTWVNPWGTNYRVPGTTLAKKDTGRTRGDTTVYQVRTCNTSGCSTWSGTDSALQRPPDPVSCTVDDITTRSAKLTVNPAAMVSSATEYTVTGGTPASGYSVTFTGAALNRSKRADQLRHGTTHTFKATTSNATGESDKTTCDAVSTPLVKISLTASPSGAGTNLQRTKSIVAHATSSNASIDGRPTLKRTSGAAPKTGEDSGSGSVCPVTSPTVCTDPDGARWYWNPLVDGASYTITATASDGVNETPDTVVTSTDLLEAPKVSAKASSAGSLQTTRSIIATVTKTNGSLEGPTLKRTNGGTLMTGEANGTGDWCGNNGGDPCSSEDDWFWDPLKENTQYTVSAYTTDDFNTSATVKANASTSAVPEPTEAVCYARVDVATDPGKIFVSGGDVVRLYTGGAEWSTSHTFTDLPDGTYYASALNINSDGFNKNYSAWDSCPGRTINPGKPAAPSEIAVGGYTPSLGYVKFTTANVANATPFTYQLRWTDQATGFPETGDVTTIAASSSLVSISGSWVTIQVQDLPSSSS